MKRDTSLFLLLISLATILVYAQALIPGKTFIADVLFRYFFPQHTLIRETLALGELPFWNPYLSGGLPFLADPLTAFFYPFTSFLALFPFAEAIKMHVVIHTILSGLFMFLLARDLKLDWRPACLAGFLYALNGSAVFHFQVPTYVQVYVWIPLAALLMRRALLGKSRPLVVGSALVLAVIFLAGFVPFIIYAGFILLAFLLGTGALRTRAAWLKFIFMAAAGLAVAAIQYAPALDFSLQTVRSSGLGVSWSLSKSLDIRQAAQMMFFPLWSWYFNLEGDLGVTGFYWGIPALILGIIGVMRARRQPLSRTLVGLCIAGFLLAFGQAGGLYPLLAAHVWPFTWLRYPANALLLANFSWPLLAGLGLQTVSKKWRLLWLVLIVLDLGLFAQKAFQTIESSFYKAVPPTARYLQDHNTNQRIFITPVSSQKLDRRGQTRLEAYLNFPDSLITDYAMVFHLHDAYGGILQLERYSHVYNALAQSAHSPWMNVMSIRHILSFGDLPGFPHVWQGPSGIHVFENKKVFPRAYFVSQAVWQPADRTLEDISQGKLNLPHIVAINEEAPLAQPSGQKSPWLPLVPQDVSPNRVSLEVTSPAAGWVVLAHSFERGWRVFVNGKKARALRVNYIQRAVQVEAGPSHIRWEYTPPQWRLGLALSGGTLFLLLLLTRKNIKSVFRTK